MSEQGLTKYWVEAEDVSDVDRSRPETFAQMGIIHTDYYLSSDVEDLLSQQRDLLYGRDKLIQTLLESLAALQTELKQVRRDNEQWKQRDEAGHKARRLYLQQCEKLEQARLDREHLQRRECELLEKTEDFTQQLAECQKVSDSRRAVMEHQADMLDDYVQQLAAREAQCKELEADLVTYKGLYAVALSKGDLCKDRGVKERRKS